MIILANQREQARLKALKAEQEAALRAHQLAATFDAMDDSVVVYSKKGEVLRTNRATRRLFESTKLPLHDQEKQEHEILRQALQHDEQGRVLPEQPIEVRLYIRDAQAQVEVRDHGPGIPEKEQERIWERFYRAPGIEAQEGPGIGLDVGLHLCRAIMDQHDGQIGVRSTLGSGSTFWFALPFAPHRDDSLCTSE